MAVSNGSSNFDESQAQTGPQYIGVESTYAVPTGGIVYDAYGNPTPGQNYRYPQYFQGYQYTPAGSTPDQIIALQRRLEDAGLLKQYAEGVWDQYSISAFQTLLGISNVAAESWTTILDRLVYVGGIQKPEDAASRNGLGQPGITDDDIRALADKVAKGVLGRSLREDEVSGFIPAFRSSIAGGTSAQVAGENVIRQQVAPVEAGGYGIGNAMQVIDSMLSGGSMQSTAGG